MATTLIKMIIFISEKDCKVAFSVMSISCMEQRHRVRRLKRRHLKSPNKLVSMLCVECNFLTHAVSSLFSWLVAVFISMEIKYSCVVAFNNS